MATMRRPTTRRGELPSERAAPPPPEPGTAEADFLARLNEVYGEGSDPDEAHTRSEWLEQGAASEPGLLDLDWDALLTPEPPGVSAGPEVADPLALFEALKEDDRPPLTGPVDRVVAEITRRIVAAWDPRRIVLFGSRARGEATGRSDIDVLVELDSYTTAQHATLGLYRSIGRTEPGVDVVVTRPEILAAHRGQHDSLYGRALREGQILYERRSGAPAAPLPRG